ncbi:zinc finger CCHC domain-containing protein 17 isoform 2-T6 [Cariama cristata]
MSSCRVDKPSEIVDVGDKVWVKLIGKEMKDDKLKLSLSMKVVNQGTGKDLDPNNVSLESHLLWRLRGLFLSSLTMRWLARGLTEGISLVMLPKGRQEPEEAAVNSSPLHHGRIFILLFQDERKKRTFRDYTSQKITLEAVLNTVCKKCGCKGHFAKECFVQPGGTKYSLIPEEEEEEMAAAGYERDKKTSLADDSSKKRKKEKKKKKKHKNKQSSESDSDSSDSDSDGAQPASKRTKHSGKPSKAQKKKKKKKHKKKPRD